MSVASDYLDDRAKALLRSQMKKMSLRQLDNLHKVVRGIQAFYISVKVKLLKKLNFMDIAKARLLSVKDVVNNTVSGFMDKKIINTTFGELLGNAGEVKDVFNSSIDLLDKVDVKNGLSIMKEVSDRRTDANKQLLIDIDRIIGYYGEVLALLEETLEEVGLI